MTYSEFLSTLSGGFTLFINSFIQVSNTLLNNYIFITLLGLTIFIFLINLVINIFNNIKSYDDDHNY